MTGDGNQDSRQSHQAMEVDVIVTTALIPGKPAPKLITSSMVQSMREGSVIVDLAAEQGGNCELTRAGETVVEHGVSIIGPENVPATVPHHASQMYGKNIENLLNHLLDDSGALKLDFDDEIIQETVLSHNGIVCQARIRELLNLPQLINPNDVIEEVA